MRKPSVLSFLLIFVSLTIPLGVFAATVTWDAGGTDDNWGTAANWSGDTEPGAADTALFDGTGQSDAIIDSGFAGTISKLKLGAAFTGTVKVQRSLTVNNAVTLSGGTLQVDSGSTITAKSTWQNLGGTFDSGTGTIILAGSGSAYTLTETGAFYNLTLNNGLIGHWKLDDGPGSSVAEDSTSGGIDGTLGNFDDDNWSTTTPGQSFANPYVANYILGESQSITFYDASLEPATRVTLSIWGYSTDPNTCNILWDKGNNAHFRIFQKGHDYLRRG